jgi:urease accessory protein
MLQLIWLASPALPVGGFSYSEALEAAVESRRIDDEASATAWLEDQLRLGLARSDLPIVAKAHAAWTRSDGQAALGLNDWVLHSRESRETRQQTYSPVPKAILSFSLRSSPARSALTRQK